jgi:RNA polymerase sigma-70 factor (ECF subfamily)
MSSDADEGLEALYRELAPRIWRALVAYTGAPEVASDALNEAFAQALARGSEIIAPERWLWTASFRIAAGDVKERRRFSPPEDAPGPGLHAPEDTSELLEALRALPPKQRAALVLHYYGGYKTREIAGILGSSAATVRVHLSAGRKRLRQLLEAGDD